MVPKTAIIIRADWQRVVRGPHLVIRDIVWPKRSFNTFFGGAGMVVKCVFTSKSVQNEVCSYRESSNTRVP